MRSLDMIPPDQTQNLVINFQVSGGNQHGLQPPVHLVISPGINIKRSYPISRRKTSLQPGLNSCRTQDPNQVNSTHTLEAGAAALCPHFGYMRLMIWRRLPSDTRPGSRCQGLRGKG